MTLTSHIALVANGLSVHRKAQSNLIPARGALLQVHLMPNSLRLTHWTGTTCWDSSQRIKTLGGVTMDRRKQQLAYLRQMRDAFVAAFTQLGDEPVTPELTAQAIDAFELRLIGQCATLQPPNTPVRVNHGWVNP
jgi:hypothetical protein